jgi:hypothetical protein
MRYAMPPLLAAGGDAAAFALFAGPAYGALIASFIGGAWWGLAANRAEGAALTCWLVASVLPMLAAWVALLLPPQAGLLLLAGAGGGAWWWINREPPVIPGTVVLAGTEASPVEVRVFRREDLAGPWRERLTGADTRGAELEKLLAEADGHVREKKLLHEEASRVCEVGEEYNMPDVAELRADRDAKEAEATAAAAEYDKLKAEKDSLLSVAGLLENLPPPVNAVVADGQGNFALPPAEGEVVLLATTVSGSGEQK